MIKNKDKPQQSQNIKIVFSFASELTFRYLCSIEICYMKPFDIEKVYNAYCRLSKSQRKTVLNRLNEKGIYITAIEAYTYPEAPGCKHLFFRFKDSNKTVPYYLLTKKQLILVQEVIHNP